MAKKDEAKGEGEARGRRDARWPAARLTDAGVKKFIKQAKTRGYVTMDELNKVLPSEEVTSEQIEDTLAMLSEMGINVVEAEEAKRREESRSARTRRKPKAARSPAAKDRRRQTASRAGRPHRRPGAHVPARDGLGGAAVARGRDRHRQAHRGRPRHHDPRPVRKRADLRSHHGLARGAGRRPHPAARSHRPRSRPTAARTAQAPSRRRRRRRGSSTPRPPRRDEPPTHGDEGDGDAAPPRTADDDDDFDDGAGSLSAPWRPSCAKASWPRSTPSPASSEASAGCRTELVGTACKGEDLAERRSASL